MPSVKKKNLVRRDAFSCYDGCRVVMPNGHPFFGSMLIFNGCRVVMPNDHYSFFVCSVLMFNGCRVVTKERLKVQCLMPSQSPSLLPC